MKQKLWIMWGVLSVTTILALSLGGTRPVVYGLAGAAALAGWAAFLLPSEHR